ncbi:MAG: fimbrillin family protein [Muribaculaceae bacterium]|nr:fimbrillin family protein [Muribaculaceae bacterium]
MKFSFKCHMLLISAAFQAGCSGGQDSPEPSPTTPTTPTEKKMEIRISPSMTRATDYGFESGDCIGLYVVNYSGSTPGSLSDSGNNVDNMRFTYDGTWIPDNTITWTDSQTHADFYLYYPYANVKNVAAHPFSVKADQSTEAAYKASDLMAGKTLDVAPSEDAISIPVSHAMSRITITLEAGNGFTAESLAKADVTVKINGVKCDASLNIASGAVTASGNPASVVPFHDNNEYKALIVPQTVEEGNLITVTADGRDFNLRKAFTFESTRSYKFTVTLSKTSAGVNVNINPWIEDGEDNGGTAE